MKKYFLLFVLLGCLTGCRLYDKYTGEPLAIMEYTLDGDHHSYEDWGYVRQDLFGKSFLSNINGGLHLRATAQDQNVAVFEMRIEDLQLSLQSSGAAFIDGKRYEYQKFGTMADSYFTHGAETSTLESGWYSFSRTSTNPCCSYELRFEFTFKGPNSTYELKDGIIQIDRRFQRLESGKLIAPSAGE